MAEPKKNTKKKNTKKTVAKKIAKPTSTSKKKQIKSTVKHTKKDTPKPTKKNTVETKEKSKDNSILLAILAILAVILIVMIAYSFFKNSNTNNVTTIPVDTNGTTGEPIDTTSESTGVTLIVIEDPSCTDCQVDFIIEQLKTNLINDLEFTKIDYMSAEGQEFVNALQLEQVPAFLFSEEMKNLDDWEAQYAPAFNEEIVDGVTYEMLNPALVQNKIFLNEIEILDGSIVVGDANAPLTIYEISDFQCPYCGLAAGSPSMLEKMPDYNAPLPRIIEEYVLTGKAKLVFYNLPLESIHPYARQASNAALCSHEQDKFIEFHEVLFHNQEEWAVSTFNNVVKEYAEDANMDVDSFMECIESNKYDEQINKEMELAQKYGISGTPAFFVGKKLLSGAQPFEAFESAINAALNE